jgi:GTP-binding protein
MEFIDKVKVKLKAGDGGNGLVAFAHTKYNPLAGPAGGDGGDGGSIIFEVDSNKSTLLDLRYQKQIKARNGEDGKTSNMHGQSADDVIIKVPLGTVVKDLASDEVIADLTVDGQREVIAKGGKGGNGNRHYANSRNSAPEYAQIGEIGEYKEVLIELKLLADVGLVGFPSVGKSTLLSVVSNARPEIADYPFTTLKPHLGIVKVKDGRSFVMADLPGLIKDASLGKGLGLDFLKHIERCRVILHVIDMSGNERDPLEDYEVINNELGQYSYNLLDRPQIVLANKMDEENAMENYNRFVAKYPDVPVYPTITLIGEGLDKVLYALADLLDKTPKFPLHDMDKQDEFKVYTYEKPKNFEVINEGNGIYHIEGEMVEKLITNLDFNNEEALLRFSRTMRNMGIDDALREKGCKNGDRVYIGNFGFDFIDEE